jgi:exopolyphosphatase/guanosine-5'-triphosphate,3'-diphosphate pyrophosphatase
MVEVNGLEVPRLGKRPLGLLDLGTNSVRLLVVAQRPDGAIETLLDAREVVRLGEGAYEAGALTARAMDRTVIAFAQLCERARHEGAETLFAVGTAALRDTSNGPHLRERIQSELGIAIEVISGEQEARLTYLGLASGLQPLPERLVTVDIGGGSTDLAVGRLLDVDAALSLPVGAIRVTEERFGGGRAAIPPEAFAAAREYVRRLVPVSMADPSAVVVTAGGTGLNLANVAARRARKPVDEGPVTRAELAAICVGLSALSVEQRREVPGLSPRRADIIVGGGAVLLGVLDALDACGFRASERGLRHGLALLAARGSASDP